MLTLRGVTFGTPNCRRRCSSSRRFNLSLAPPHGHLNADKTGGSRLFICQHEVVKSEFRIGLPMKGAVRSIKRR